MGKSVCKKGRCSACMACMDICPKKCIEIKDELDTVAAIKNESRCINCGLCEKVCPSITHPMRKEPLFFYQGWADKPIREKSSSGGAATSIMLSFIENGGYVASCMFNCGEFLFLLTNNKDDVEHFSGSKYVKSSPKNIYKKVADFLKDNRVLFVGLPCQIAAMINYAKLYSTLDNLYTIDILCHGTPSEKLLEIYLKDYDISLDKISDIKFRSPTCNAKYINKESDDYSISFVKCITCTDNCLACEYVGVMRASDLTLGDSWGTNLVDEVKNGISLILCQTDKGKELLSKSSLSLQYVDSSIAIAHNQPLQGNCKPYRRRAHFFSLLKKCNSFKLAFKIVYPSLFIRRKIKELFVVLGLKRNIGRYIISYKEKARE